MAEQPQIILAATFPPDKPKGARQPVNLKASFPDSPIYKGEITDEERRELFQELALDGVVQNGNGFSAFNRDYVGSTKDPIPNINDVATGGGGLPASPYIPNLTSPGPGSLNYSDQPVFNGILPDAERRGQFGTGLGGLVSPSETSEMIGQQNILGGYISGRSYQGSDGKN